MGKASTSGITSGYPAHHSSNRVLTRPWRWENLLTSNPISGTAHWYKTLSCSSRRKIFSASDLAIPKHRTEYFRKKTKPNASQSGLLTLLPFVWITVVGASIPKRRMIKDFGTKCGKWMFHRRCEPSFGEHALRFSPHGPTLLEGDYLLILAVTSADTKKKWFVMSYGSAH